MASSGSIYSNYASGSFTSSGTKYSFSDAQWYITWTQSHVSNGRSKVEFLVYTTKSNKSPRNMNTKGTITITAKTGTIVSGNTSLDFGNKTRAYAISGGSNIVPQSTATNKVAETYSFLIDHDASGAAAFTVAFRFDIAVGAWNCTGGGDGTLDTNHWNRTLTVNKGTGIHSTTGGGTIRGGTSTTVTASASSGYSFSKWTDGSGTQKSTSASYTFTMPTSNLTLTANATANKYKITFNANGGTNKSGGNFSVTGYDVSYGNGTTTSYVTTTYNTSAFGSMSGNIPTRTNYKFLGWYTAASGGTQVYTAGGIAVNGTSYWNASGNWCYANNLTVYAHWELLEYTIYFDGNGGTIPYTTKTAIVNNSIILPTASECSKRGSELLGWSTTSVATSATYSPGASYTVTTNGVTLYAIWMVGNRIWIKDGNTWKLGTKIYFNYNGVWIG